MLVGTPSAWPPGAPVLRCAGLLPPLAWALARALGAASTQQKALICGLRRSMRESTACVASTGLACPLRYSCSNSCAVHWVRSVVRMRVSNHGSSGQAQSFKVKLQGLVRVWGLSFFQGKSPGSAAMGPAALATSTRLAMGVKSARKGLELLTTKSFICSG